MFQLNMTFVHRQWSQVWLTQIILIDETPHKSVSLWRLDKRSHK